MNANATVQQLKDLKLTGMVRSYESVFHLPAQKQPEAHTLIAQLCDAELQYRVHYKTQFFLKLSKLRYAAMLEEISYAKERNLKAEQIAALADCSFIRRSENILIRAVLPGPEKASSPVHSVTRLVLWGIKPCI